MSFTHLHVHSYYSLMDGLNSPAELVKAAKDAGQTALAITDHGTLSSHREMQIACQEQGIKPILGVEAYISPTDRFDRSSKTSCPAETSSPSQTKFYTLLEPRICMPRLKTSLSRTPNFQEALQSSTL